MVYRNPQIQLIFVASFRGNIYRNFAVVGKLDQLAGQIGEDLPQTRFVASESGGQVGGALTGKFNVFFL